MFTQDINAHLRSVHHKRRPAAKDGCPLKARTYSDTLCSLRVLVEHSVTYVFDVKELDLQDSSRGPAVVALARQTAMYLTHIGVGMTMTDFGTLFERDRTTVSHACALIEDRRDNDDFDRALELLERAIVALHYRSYSFGLERA